MSSKVIKCLSPLSVNERALLIEDAKIIMAHDGSSYEDAMIESANDIIAEYVGHKNTALKEVIAQFESRNESVKIDPVKQQSSKPDSLDSSRENEPTQETPKNEQVAEDVLKKEEKLNTDSLSKLLNGEISVAEYGQSLGLSEEQIDDAIIGKFSNKPNTEYSDLINAIRADIEQRKQALQKPATGSASVNKAYSDTISKWSAALDTLAAVEREYANPFSNQVKSSRNYAPLPKILERMFGSKFEGIATGDAARKQSYKEDARRKAVALQQAASEGVSSKKEGKLDTRKTSYVDWFVNYTEQDGIGRTTETKRFSTLKEANEFANGKLGYITKADDGGSDFNSTKATTKFVSFFGGFSPSAQEELKLKLFDGYEKTSAKKVEPVVTESGKDTKEEDNNDVLYSKSSEPLQPKQSDEGKALYSKAIPENTLAIIHNLSLRNLLHAVKMNGIPVPSVAVVDKNTPMDSFGEITLIGNKDTLGPGASSVNRYFNADIYSPRYPEVTHIADYKAIKQANESLSENAKKVQRDIGYRAEITTDSVERGLVRGLGDNLALMYQYLESIGKAPVLILKKKRVVEKEFMPFVKSEDGLRGNEAFRIAVVDQYNKEHDKDIAYDSTEAYNLANHESYAIEEARKEAKNGRPVDVNALGKKVRTKLNQSDFEAWLVDNYSDIIKDEKIFDGFTNRGDRKYLPHNLDSVVRVLNRSVQGGEGFSYGVPSIRAHAAKQFKTVKALQDARSDLISKEQMDSLKDEVNSEFEALAEELYQYKKFDLAEPTDALSGLASKGMREFNEYYKDVPAETMQKVNDFLNKLKHMPSHYFEGKIGRAVQLREFDGALVPLGKEYDEAVEILKRKGITNIKRYKSGDIESRAKALKSFDNLFFSKSESPESFARQAITMMVSEHPEMMQVPIIDKSVKDLSEIITGIDKGYEVDGITDMPDNTGINPVKQWNIKLPEKEGRADKYATISQLKNGNVYVDVSMLDSGEGGNVLYAVAGNFARNTGVKFIGDPRDLSKMAMVRRTENMLSLAAKFGTTDFIEPHKFQEIEWIEDDDQGNFERLIAKSQENIIYGNDAAYFNGVPDLQLIDYNFETNQLEWSDGQRISQEELKGIVRRANDRIESVFDQKYPKADRSEGEGAPKVGGATITRAAIIQSLVRAEGEGRSRILGSIVRESGKRLTDAKDAFYSGNANNVTGSTVEDVIALLPKRVKALLDAGKLKVVQSHEDGKVEAFYQDGAIVLVADMINADNINSILSHELLHLAKRTDPKVKAALERFEQYFQDSFNRAAKGIGSKIEREAYARVVTAGTKKSAMLEEYMAYQITAYQRNPESFPARLVKAIKDFIGAIRAALVRSGLDFGYVKTLTPADLTALAGYGAKVGKESALASDAAMADIRYSKNTTPVNSDPFENPKDVVKNLVGAEARNLPHWDDVKSSIIGGFQKMGSKERKEMLGFLSLRNLADLAETVGILPILNQSYVPTIQKMVAAQNKITSEAGKLSETWLKLYTSNRAANENLVSLMGDETTSGIDGSKPWVSKLTPEQVQEIIDKKPSKATKRAIRLDKKRRAKHAELSKRYNELPPAFRAMHDQVRDTYQKWFDNRYKALQDRILDEEGTSTAKAQRIDSIRAVFESMQVDGPYFPLPRFGDYWVKGVDKDGNIFVESVETLEQQTALKKEILSDGGIIKAEGVKPSELGSKNEVSADFIAKVDEMVKTLGNNEAVNEVRDGMYQLYLSTLPSLSNRKHQIHRKNRLGWSRDMLRAFSEIGLHEAKQYSKLKYGHKLDQIISDIGSGIGMAENPANRSKAEKKISLLLEAFDESESDKGRAAIRNMIDRLERRIEISRKARYQGNFEFARNIHSEVQQQYKAMMEPSTAGWATVVNAVGFGWFLGGSIMSGVVNTSQNMLTVNAAAAELESIKGLSALPIVAKEFALAAKDFVTHMHDGQADIAGGLKTMGERRAYVQFNQHELFDKTQGHDLSGIAQGGFKAGSFARYVATKLGFFFHHAERFNRQVSAIAIYRAAIKSDMHHQAAADLAERLVWKTHYDYSAWNRARHLRSPVARIAMQFKQYGMSTTFLLGESWYKSVWKDPNISVKDRRKARAFFGGVMASQMILAGAQGLPAGLATVMLGASALGARGVPFTKAINISIGLTAAAAMALALGLGDDDDDNDQFIDDTEAWVKQWLADHVGKTWEQLIMSGVIDSLTPVGLSNRVSMNGLLVRSSDKEMEGDPTAAWAAWAQTFLGPTAGGMTFDMLFLGPDLMNRGEIWKGLEHLMPTVARGVSKSIRGQVNGITNMAGNQIVKDVTPVETALQFMGDTPSRISRQYDLNNAEKNRESRIANRRKELLRDMNKARTAGDTEEMNSIRAEIVKFNQQNRESVITGKTIIQAAKSKARIERKSEGGLYLKDGREYDF